MTTIKTPGTGPTTAPPEPVDPERLEQFVGMVITDAGGAMVLPLALIGDRLRIFDAMRQSGSSTSTELAESTGLDERYLREWLRVMAAAGYVTYDGGDDESDEPMRAARFRLSAEQADAFTNPDSPGYIAGGLQNLTAATRMLDRLTDAFRTGEGIGWHEQHEDMFEGTERFFRPGYLAHLAAEWIPAMDGMQDRLLAGARVADIGCGFGASTLIMAEAYPASRFEGVDYHEPSIEAARRRAERAGVADRVTFRRAAASDLTGHYDLVTFFDCLHDMPDPVGALRAARAAVEPDGRVLLVEPMSWDRLPDALADPLGRVLAGASLFVCLPSGLSAEPRAGLGNQVGPSRMIALAREAGFADARVVAETMVNLIYQLTP